MEGDVELYHDSVNDYCASYFLKPVKYGFTTMYSVASYEIVEGVKRGLETPEEVIAKVNNVFRTAAA